MIREWAVLAGTLCLCSSVTVGMAAPVVQENNGPGVQLRQQQEHLERERLEQEMAAQREGQKTEVENQQTPPESQAGSLRFVLQSVTLDESAVLPTDVRDRILQPYLGKEVTLDDLYAIVAEINKFYQNNQYLTCRAYLPPQTIHAGVVHIALFEGRNGQVHVEQNANTRTSYILNRLDIQPEKIESMEKLNEQLRWFNGTNDVKLRIALQAGQKPGTTDYVITAQEPKNQQFTFYGDNAGSMTTGRWREGIFYTNRSVFGWRDSLMLGFLHAQGLNSFNVDYTVPLGLRGTRLSLDYSTNGTEIIGGQYHDWGIDVRGHAYSAGMTLTQPLYVTDTAKVEASFTVQRQHSVTDVIDVPLLDDLFTDYTAALALTNYGRGWALYQKHAFTHGSWDNESLTRLAMPSADYNLYDFTGVFQKGAAHGQLFTVRANLQWSATRDLRPSKQFFLGGVYSVRGYQENLIGGDNGYTVSLEYAVPVDSHRLVSLYGFLDYGNIWGDSDYEQHVLVGTGIGLRAKLAQIWSLDCALGFPLRRNMDGGTVDRTRVHVSLSAQF